MSDVDPDLLWSISATMFVMCIPVVVNEIKTGGKQFLSTLLKLLGSLSAVVAISINDMSWFDYVLIVVFSIGIVLDLLKLRSMLSNN